MMHGFTILLPEEYRIHGHEIVAVSFFSTSPDHNDGSHVQGYEGIRPVIETPGNMPPSDAQLRPFWERACMAHPRTYRMYDILDCAYAVILLTREEFEAGPCLPPPAVDSPLVGMVSPPVWLSKGAFSFSESFGGGLVSSGEDLGEGHVHRAIKLTARANDPNAGLSPRDYYGEEPEEGGYQPFFYWLHGRTEIENWREHEWADGHAANHIGGTMRPAQNTPDFSPYYIEFEEDFGGYNFGGGNAQLDFRDMKFDFAC